jgi:uncharacterized protein
MSPSNPDVPPRAEPITGHSVTGTDRAAPTRPGWLFRGVVATALMRYGTVVGVAGSAVIFAAVHGPDAVAVTAVLVGLINVVLLRRSGSIWPGVVAHAVNNLIGSGVGVVLAATM